VRRTWIALASLPLLCGACGLDDRRPETAPDCSAFTTYEFQNISNFSGSTSGWFRFADPTPGGKPNPTVDGTSSDPGVEGSDVPVAPLEAPSHCGDVDHQGMRLTSAGHNFWGAGYGEWQHNAAGARADGTGYAGISFWARAEPGTEKQFLLSVNDGRTIVLAPAAGTAATAADQDLDGDGLIGPGDIVSGTSCRLPPPPEAGDVVCYSGGVGGPSGGARVPGVNECGNAFHARVTLGESWQLVLIPWRDLVQWPCPNRLAGGIDPADVASFEVKLIQGAVYDFVVDDIAFYR
jgi:hypothetical protein